MFKKKEPAGTEFDTFIGGNTSFEGNISSEGSIRVDGKITGDLKATGNIYIGNTGIVKGSVFANDVFVSGTVEGNIHSNGVLRILSTAKISGDIHVRSFVADEGGVFQGKCIMLESSETVAPPQKSPSKKSHSNKDYMKSSVLSQVYEEKEKNNELKSE